jgi:hypothetical protein
MTHHRHRILPSLILPLMLVVVAATMFGCGKRGRELAPISGKVIYRGKPLQFGSVLFQSEYGQPSVGAIQSDGTFQLVTRGEGDGAVIGKNRVCVACFESQGAAKKSPVRGELSLGKSLIPTKYTSIDTSGLTIDVRPGKNEPVVLNLTDRP